MGPPAAGDDPITAAGRERAIAAVRGGEWKLIYLDGHFVGRVDSYPDGWRARPAPDVERWDHGIFDTPEAAADAAYDAWLATPDGSTWRRERSEQ